VARPSGGDDDEPADEWAPRRNLDDTSPELHRSDILELDGDATTPPRGLETLPGYDLGVRAGRMAFFARWGDMIAEVDRLGHRRGAADVLHELRDALTKQGFNPEFVDEFVRRIAKNAGVKLV
jgi:hypothetical protein